jgi:hypothetical protein
VSGLEPAADVRGQRAIDRPCEEGALRLLVKRYLAAVARIRLCQV